MDTLTVKITILGLLAYSGTKMTAINLGNREPLRQVDMRAIRSAAEELQAEGKLQAGPGYGASKAYFV